MRPIVRRLLVCLVLGALATLAACWLPGAIIDTGRYRVIDSRGEFSMQAPHSESHIRAVRLAAPGMDVLCIFHWRHSADRSVGPMPTGDEPELAGVMTRPLRRVVWPAMKATIESNTSGFGYIMEVRGWPARGFWWASSHWNLHNRSFEGAIDLGGAHATLKSDILPRALPYRPIWSGLAINLAFWSGIAVPLVFAPIAIRRLRRMRRGACTACGYDLSGLPAGAPCPECGRNRARTPQD